MNNKFLYVLGFTFLFIACHTSEVNNTSRNEIQANLHQMRHKSDGPNRCVRSEGGYETTSYCITIFNTENLHQVPQKVKIFIKDKKTKNIQYITGEEWLDDDYNMYGFKARSKDKIYEIDWREEKTHFRIWDASHKKLLEDELVIVGPEDILKDKSINP